MIIKYNVEKYSLANERKGREVNNFLTDSLLFPNDNEDELEAAAIRH